MSPNTNTSPLKRSKSTNPMSGIRPKRLSAASSLVKRSSMMMIGESGGGGSGDEHVGLKRKDDGLNKTVAALMVNFYQLRSRVLELENAIDHGTSPEVEKLTKEVSTLEDLLEETQRDNEATHAESERQKQYVKDLENLLTELAGPHWRCHCLYPPSQTQTYPSFAPFRLFFQQRSASKLHHRSSSTLDLAALGMTLSEMGLHAVKEVGEGRNNTPTGALQRLCGNSSTELKAIEQDTRKAKKKLKSMALVKTPEPDNDLALVEERTSSGTALKSCNIDYEKLNQVLDILSTFDPSKLSAFNAGPCTEPQRCDEKAERMGRQERVMLQRMFDEQEKRLKPVSRGAQRFGHRNEKCNEEDACWNLRKTRMFFAFPFETPVVNEVRQIWGLGLDPISEIAVDVAICGLWTLRIAALGLEAALF
ncbi:hypothetical protein D1P53_003078 [Cryptococcus gattii VGV]|nr:hypothetical protein D1P53_003078 [Cryptococcus gattii VGV]